MNTDEKIIRFLNDLDIQIMELDKEQSRISQKRDILKWLRDKPQSVMRRIL